MKALAVYFKRISMGKILLSVFIVTALCFFSHPPAYTANPPTLIELSVTALKGENLIYTYQDIIGWFDNSAWFYIILPVILSFPALSDFYEEWFGGGYYLNLSRQQVLSYVLSKSLACSLWAVICFAAGLTLFILPVLLLFPGADPEIAAAIYPEGFFIHILSRMLNSSALAAAYPLICVISLILIKQKFLSLSIPMLINYLTMQAGTNLLIQSVRQEDPFYEKLAMLMPAMQNNQYGSFERVYGLPIFVWYIAWAAFYLLLMAALYFLVKRRLKGNA